MGLFNNKKKVDPISERSRALSAEIAALEAQIKELDGKMQHAQTTPQPRLRSTALPHQAASSTALPRLREPVFEEVDHERMKEERDLAATPAHFNELGVRKFDLVAAWRNLRNHVHGPSANNPKLVNYLAAGSIQGLRPLRYEKRVARNRVIALTLLLIGVGWIIVAVLQRR